MNDIEAVRLKTSDKSIITREKGVGNGVDKYFKLKSSNLLATPAPEVRANQVLLTVGAQYTVDLINGIVAFTAIPAQSVELEFTYYWSVFSDAEIQYFLDQDGSSTIAAAHILLAWAADAAKVAKRQTLSGGGGLGQTVVDTSVIARELRATAQAMIQTEKDLGESIPAEGLTEVPWTESSFRDQVEQHYVRNN